MEKNVFFPSFKMNNDHGISQLSPYLLNQKKKKKSKVKNSRSNGVIKLLL
jgi:hypothetical protein